MIYLFEDRKGRMEQYLSQEIISKNFEETIFDCQDESIGNYIEKEFGDAKAILFHSSYTIPNKRITKENIRAAFIRRGVPFIFFSGGMENNYFRSGSTIQATVNSGIMYQNLHLFMAHFDKTGDPNIPMLIYGEKYLLNELITIQHLIVAYSSSKNNSTILNTDERNYIVEYIIEPIIKTDILQEDKVKLISWIMKADNKIDIATLKDQLHKLIEKYRQ